MNAETLKLVGRIILSTFFTSTYIIFMMLTVTHYTQSNMECDIIKIREIVKKNEHNIYFSDNYLEVNKTIAKEIPFYSLENHIEVDKRILNMIQVPYNDGTMRIICK